MSELSLQTKITFSKLIDAYKDFIPLQLKDGSILLCANKNIIFILYKNFKFDILINFSNNKNFETHSNITNIKQLKNGKVICCCKDLYLFNIKSKIIKENIIKIPNNEYILDVIELKNGKIIGITIYSILNIKIKDYDDYYISQIFKIPQDWLITPISKDIKFLKNFKQFVNIYELQDNKLLIHFQSKELLIHGGVSGAYPPLVIFENKIIILNLENFKIIHKFEKFCGESNTVILSKYICIIYNGIIYIYIYNINDYKLLKIIDDRINKTYIIKYNENIIISMSKFENYNDIILYYLFNINDIKYKIYKGDFMKFKVSMDNFDSDFEIGGNNNKTLYKLNNGSFLLAYCSKIFIFEIPDSLNCKRFKSLSQSKY